MGLYIDKETRRQFAITKEELKKLSDGFHSEALPLADSLYNLTFWVTLNKRTSKKIIKDVYYKAIDFCEKTKADSDWNTWLHRILMKDLYEYFEKKKGQPAVEFETIDKIAVDLPFVEKFFNDKKFLLQYDEKALITFLESVPSLYLIPLMMREIHSFNYEPISEYVDVPEGVISSRMFRGRKLLFFHLLKGLISEEEKNIQNSTVYSPVTIFELRKTAELVDGEIKDEIEKKSLLSKLDEDRNLKLEYVIQERVSSILRNIPQKKNIPHMLLRGIKKKAKKEFSTSGSKYLTDNPM